MPASVGSEAGFSFLNAYRGGTRQEKTPIQLHRFSDANATINIDFNRLAPAQKPCSRDAEKIASVKFLIDRERLRQFARP